MTRLAIRPCKVCQRPFSGCRQLKYCSNSCRDAAAKAQRAEWERTAKRPPHLYRAKKVPKDEIQYEFALDDPCTGVYEEAS